MPATRHRHDIGPGKHTHLEPAHGTESGDADNRERPRTGVLNPGKIVPAESEDNWQRAESGDSE